MTGPQDGGSPSFLTIRRLGPDEAWSFLEVHHVAVHGTAVADYPANVVEAWAPLPVTDEAVARLGDNPEGEIRLAALLHGEIVGIGVIAPKSQELRACYVLPAHSRDGVGRALVEALEAIAREHGLTRLDLDASLTAEGFYRRLGYEVVRRGEHVLRGGVSMACVIMRKDLGAA